MSAGNIGYLYYKEYFEDFFKRGLKPQEDSEESTRYFGNKNKIIIGNSIVYEIEEINSIGKDKLYFKTTYPGLLIGSGYNHIISCKDEFKLGFEFDYTTGLPVINGSSVKGMLRSMFYSKEDPLVDEKMKYINDLISDLGKNYQVSSLDKFKELTDQIFEGKNKDKSISMSDRDIFFEAVIDIVETKKLNRNNINLLGEDFITPHNENELKNPTPLKFIKVMPNVVWRFQFDLKDSFENESGRKDYELKAIDKKRLFERIILDLGIGAKTNVGYGRLENIK
jgi:CRISPR-associated protein Cmr6